MSVYSGQNTGQVQTLSVCTADRTQAECRHCQCVQQTEHRPSADTVSVYSRQNTGRVQTLSVYSRQNTGRVQTLSVCTADRTQAECRHCQCIEQTEHRPSAYSVTVYSGQNTGRVQTPSQIQQTEHGLIADNVADRQQAESKQCSTPGLDMVTSLSQLTA